VRERVLYALLAVHPTARVVAIDPSGLFQAAQELIAGADRAMYRTKKGPSPLIVAGQDDERTARPPASEPGRPRRRGRNGNSVVLPSG
jgi:hypothetical protein